MNTFITFAAFAALQAMVQDPHLTQHEEDAAAIAIRAYYDSKPIDHHVASVLHGYVVRSTSLQQNRYGQ